MDEPAVFLRKALFHWQLSRNAIQKILPLMKENKVLIISLNNLFLSYSNAMHAILLYWKKKGYVRSVPDSYQKRLDLIQKKMQNKLRLKHFSYEAALSLKDMVKAHKDSSTEFSRGKNFIICDSTFKYKTLSPHLLDNFALKTKLFIDEVIHLLDNK